MPLGMNPITGKRVTRNQAQPAVNEGQTRRLNQASAVSAATNTAEAATCGTVGPTDE